MDARALDDILVKAYEAFDTPVDRFIGDAGRTEAFVAVVRREAGESGLDSHEVMNRLVALRKKGRLPRLRRNYFGRAPGVN